MPRHHSPFFALTKLWWLDCSASNFVHWNGATVMSHVFFDITCFREKEESLHASVLPCPFGWAWFRETWEFLWATGIAISRFIQVTNQHAGSTTFIALTISCPDTTHHFSLSPSSGDWIVVPAILFIEMVPQWCHMFSLTSPVFAKTKNRCMHLYCPAHIRYLYIEFSGHNRAVSLQTLEGNFFAKARICFCCAAENFVQLCRTKALFSYLRQLLKLAHRPCFWMAFKDFCRCMKSFEAPLWRTTCGVKCTGSWSWSTAFWKHRS